MLITLGFSMIAVFMYLILSKRLTPMVALILVPLTFAVLAGAFGVTGEAEEGVVDSIMTAVGDFAPTAVLLFFAIIYFGMMIDVGLFDPLIRFILRVVGHDPVRERGRAALQRAARPQRPQRREAGRGGAALSRPFRAVSPGSDGRRLPSRLIDRTFRTEAPDDWEAGGGRGAAAAGA